MVCVISGVIIVSNPDSLLRFYYDHIHVVLFCGSLFFALGVTELSEFML